MPPQEHCPGLAPFLPPVYSATTIASRSAGVAGSPRLVHRFVVGYTWCRAAASDSAPATLTHLVPRGVLPMPNKYEREIEEILRNMDRTDQTSGLGDRIRAFNRPSKRTRVARPRWRWRLAFHETLFVLGVALALVGAGLNYYFSRPADAPWVYVSGGLGVAGLICLIWGLVIAWSARFGRPAPAMWRGQRVKEPRRFRPFNAIATQFRIMQLKWRYWRSRGR